MNKSYELFGKKLTAMQLLAGLSAALSIVVIFFVIIPQIENLGLQRAENARKQEEVDMLESSLSTLQSTNPQQLETDLEVVSAALPTNKDVIAIFSSLSTLATDSNVQLRGFTIRVGDVYSKDDADLESIQSAVTTVPGFPTLDVIITLGAQDNRNLTTFSNNLYKNMPIAKINTVSGRENESTMEISFYYRPVDLNQIRASNEVRPYTQDYAPILQELQQ